MTDDTLKPISLPVVNKTAVGRRADILAGSLSVLGALLSSLAAIWFFAGFAENDTRPEHLASALVLTLILFAFAIGPFTIVAILARQAYRKGTKRAHLFWTLLLMLPWVGLGTLAVSHTPLPIFCGLIMVILASLISIWAIASLILDWRTEPNITGALQKIELTQEPE